jgi:polysaccharide export outer membrane protein
MRFKALVAIIPLCVCLQTAVAQQNTAKEHGAFGESEYKLGPEDVIEVFVWKEADLSVPSEVVRPDGKISLPLIGEIQASGKTQAQLEGEISQKLKQLFPNPLSTSLLRKCIAPRFPYSAKSRNPVSTQ